MKPAGALAILLVLLAGIAITAHLSTTDLEFSRYNAGWTGTSGFFSDLERRGARDLGSYDDLAGRSDTTLLLIAPNGSFSPGEIARVREFLREGNNTVFVADETGESESLLAGLSSRVRVRPGAVCSAEMEFWDYYTVIAYPREADPLVSDVSSLTFNRPSSVTGGEVLVATTLISWVDVNDNYHLDENETLSSYGLLARERVGNGTLYVLSDPSLCINGMRNARLSGDNGVFLAQLLSLHPDLLVEQTHSLTGRADPVLAAVLWVKKTTIITISALIGSVLLVAVAFWRRWI